jgi:predicted ATP-grasp superfamily ATP-dependent carboligase
MLLIFGLFSEWPEQINLLKSPNYKVMTANIVFNKNIKNKKNKKIKKNITTLIIPCSLEEMHLCNLSSNLHLTNIICCRDSEIIMLLSNKIMFNTWLLENFNLNVPKVFKTQLNNIITNFSNITYPTIYKNNNALAGRGSYVLESERDLRENITQEDHFIQEYIKHPQEFVGHFYVKNKKILFTKVFTCSKEGLYITYGRILNYTDLKNEQILEKINTLFSSIFEKLNYNGFACTDIKILNDNVKIFEINPRLGGSIISNTRVFQEMLDIVVENKN